MKPLMLFLPLLLLCSKTVAASLVMQTPARGIVFGSPIPDMLWWQFNENTGTSVADSSGNGRTLALSSASMWTTGKAGYGIAGNGSSYYANSTSTINFGTNKITITLWFYAPTFANDDKLAFELTTNFNNNDGAFICNPNSSSPVGFVAGIQDSAGITKYRMEYFTRPSAAAWHNYLFVYDNSTNAGDIIVYVDGSSTSTTISTNSKDQSGNFITATLYLLSRAGASLFSSGTIDDFRIYTGDRSADAVSIYNDPK